MPFDSSIGRMPPPLVALTQLGATSMPLMPPRLRIANGAAAPMPDSIGQATSSGCIRLTNEDVIDLYSRVRIGTPVIVQ